MRIRTVAVATAMALTLAACGGGEPGSDETDTSSASQTDTGDAPEADGEPIEVGTLVFQSGAYQQLGDDVISGMRQALDEAGGAAAGRPIEIIVEDETSDPNTAAEKTRAFIDEDVDFIVGYISTGSAYAVRDTLDEAGIPTLVANAGGNALTAEQASDSIFRVSFSTGQVTKPLAPWVAENVGTTAAIVAADYGFGQESAADFTEAFEAAGGEVTSSHFPPLGSEDFNSYITQIAGEQPDMVFTFLAGTDATLFLQQYQQAGLAESIPLVTTFMTTEEALDATGTAATGIRSTMHWVRSLETDVNQAFVSSFEETNGRTASVYAVQGYDAMNAIIAAVEESGGDTDPAVVNDILAGLEWESPRGMISFDDNHQVIQHVYLREAQEVDGAVHNVLVEDLGIFNGDGTAN